MGFASPQRVRPLRTQRISNGCFRFSAFLSAVSNAIQEPCAEASIRSGGPVSPCRKTAEPWVLVATILGSSMAFIDGTVVNVALPALQSALNATVTDVQWVIEAYSLLLSALLLVGGSLGDRYGRRRVFIIGVVIFSAASTWCGLATGIRPLIIARAAQGFGAALLVPGSLAIISSSFREEDRGRAIGTWSGFSAITTAIGPVLGGWLIERFSWRAVFFINLPLAIIVVVICYWRIPESSSNEKGRLDWLGATVIALGLGALVWGLIESARLGLAHPAIGFGLFMLTGVVGSYWKTFFPPVILLGIGMVVSVAPLTTTVMSSVAETRAGVASALNNAVSRVAGLLAIAVLGIVMLREFNYTFDMELSDLPSSIQQSLDQQRAKLAAGDLPQNIPSAVRAELRDAIDYSFVAGFRAVMFAGALLAAGGAICAWRPINALADVKR